MDARAQLRRYLEQRRDAGDQELVLDTMSVDEVMRLLGALKGRPVETVVPIPVAPPVAPPSVPAPAPLPVVSEGQPILVGKAGSELSGGPHAALKTLDDVAAAATACTRCSLYQSATHCVPGEGSPQAKLVCVGEAPGETEDKTGRPFVGKAGQLLTKILAAIDVKREDAFIVNVLKHRPPGNRNPLPTEVAACSPFLVRQIELLRPKVILALGTFAAQTLLESKLSIGKLRGTIHRYYGVPLIVTYHPAALLRNPGWKRPAWEDVQQARRLLDADAPDGA
ncbi:MAG TPA: uracil-DNA glycosylase [Gemmatimonadaceae bacterium]|nr:uracil-DNA glycosylase [Gemmatimonadaceae bacterium]